MKLVPTFAALLVLEAEAAPLHARWESAADNKTVIELQAMTSEQLFDEAFDACMQRTRAQQGPKPAAQLSEASAYLNTIYPHARERNGGTVPEWMSQLFTAYTPSECERARRYVGTRPPSTATLQEPAAAVGPLPTKRRPPQKVIARPRPTPTSSPEWSEALPPWLAPGHR